MRYFPDARIVAAWEQTPEQPQDAKMPSRGEEEGESEMMEDE